MVNAISTAVDIASRPQPNASETGLRKRENVDPTSDGMLSAMPAVTAAASSTPARRPLRSTSDESFTSGVTARSSRWLELHSHTSREVAANIVEDDRVVKARQEGGLLVEQVVDRTENLDRTLLVTVDIVFRGQVGVKCTADLVPVDAVRRARIVVRAVRASEFRVKRTGADEAALDADRRRSLRVGRQQINGIARQPRRAEQLDARLAGAVDLVAAAVRQLELVHVDGLQAETQRSARRLKQP